MTDENDEKPEGEQEAPDNKKAVFNPEQQAEVDRLIGATRKKEREKAKAEVQAEFEVKQKTAKEEAEKSAMQEQGEFKKLAEKADREKTEALTDAASARKEANDLKLRIAFEDAAEELGIEFVNKQAAKDAFDFLDKEVAGEDGANIKKAVEKLGADRPYLLKPDAENHETDARQKGPRPKKETLDKEKESELSQRFRIRKPR